MDYFKDGLTISDYDIIISIDYADRAVANHIISIIDSWISSLSIDYYESSERKILRRAYKTFEQASILMIISVLIGGFIFEPSKILSNLTPVRYLMAIILLSLLFGFIGEKISSYSNHLIMNIARSNIIIVTGGDRKNELEKIRKRDRSIRLLTLLGSGLILGLVVGVLGNLLSAKLLTG